MVLEQRLLSWWNYALQNIGKWRRANNEKANATTNTVDPLPIRKLHRRINIWSIFDFRRSRHFFAIKYLPLLQKTIEQYQSGNTNNNNQSQKPIISTQFPNAIQEFEDTSNIRQFIEMYMTPMMYNLVMEEECRNSKKSGFEKYGIPTSYTLSSSPKEKQTQRVYT